MNKKKFALIIFFHLVIANQIYSQVLSDSLLKNVSSGVDVVNLLTFLQKKPESCLLNFRYNLKGKKTVRLGMNLDLSNGNSAGYYPDIRLGIQKNRRNDRWNLYYGFDLSYFYFKSTANPSTSKRIGVSPLLGVEYYFNNHISILTEENLNFYQFYDYNPTSFDNQKRTQYYRINVGSVGMVLLMYHF